VKGSLSKLAFRKLVLALAGASGIESYIALKEVCGLDDSEVDEILWMIIQAIFEKALGEQMRS
jgi:hypothetical protein